MQLDEAWTGIMIEYTEQDFPTSKPYRRRIPGWQCTACGHRIGTAGPPPKRCVCGQTWHGSDCEDQPDRDAGRGIGG